AFFRLLSMRPRTRCSVGPDCGRVVVAGKSVFGTSRWNGEKLAWQDRGAPGEEQFGPVSSAPRTPVRRRRRNLSASGRALLLRVCAAVLARSPRSLRFPSDSGAGVTSSGALRLGRTWSAATAATMRSCMEDGLDSGAPAHGGDPFR